MCQDWKSSIFFTINFSIQCEAMIYSFLRLCQMHIIGRYENMNPYVIHCFNMVGFGYPVYLQIYTIVYGESFCNYFNQAVAYDKELRKKYWIKKAVKALDFLETGVSLVVPFVYFQGICFGMYSLMKPSKPFFHCSLLMDLGWPTSSQIPVKIYECYMFFNCWHVIVSVWLTLCVASYSIVMWPMELIQSMKERFEMVKLRMPEKVKYKSADEIRTVCNSLSTYECLYMLSNRMNAVVRVWLAGVSLYAGKFVAVYMGFASFQLALEQSLPWKEYMAYPTSCLFLGVLFAFVSPEAEALHTFSCKYIQQLKSQPNRILRKRLKTLRPMAIWIVDMFYFQRGTSIEICNDIIEEIGDMVVGFVG